MCVDHKGKTKEFYNVFVLTRQRQQQQQITINKDGNNILQ